MIYRVDFTYTEQGHVDIDAPGIEEAKERFWLTTAGLPRYASGDMTQVVVSHCHTPQSH